MIYLCLTGSRIGHGPRDGQNMLKSSTEWQDSCGMDGPGWYTVIVLSLQSVCECMIYYDVNIHVNS